MNPLALAGIGAGASLLGGLFGAGSKVKIPELQKVDVGAEQKNAISQNLAAFEPASQLAAKTTAADQSVLEAQLRKAIPNYDQIIGKVSQNISSALSGEINPDVAAQVQRSAAGKALAGGFGGSQMGTALTARDLGLTSTQLQNQGFQQALNFIQNQRSAATVQPYSAANMFISPSQQIAIKQQENALQFQRDMAQAQQNARPDPMLAAFGGFLGQAGGMATGIGLQQYLQTPAPVRTPYTGAAAQLSNQMAGSLGYTAPTAAASTFYPGWGSLNAGPGGPGASFYSTPMGVSQGINQFGGIQSFQPFGADGLTEAQRYYQ